MVNMEEINGFSISGSHQERHNREEGTNEITWLPSDVRGGTVPSSAVITSSNQRADGVYLSRITCV